MNENLRQQTKILKALQGISYAEIAEYMEIHVHSFYNWLNNQYNFTTTNCIRLQQIINTLKEY